MLQTVPACPFTGPACLAEPPHLHWRIGSSSVKMRCRCFAGD